MVRFLKHLRKQLKKKQKQKNENQTLTALFEVICYPLKQQVGKVCFLSQLYSSPVFLALEGYSSVKSFIFRKISKNSEPIPKSKEELLKLLEGLEIEAVQKDGSISVEKLFVEMTPRGNNKTPLKLYELLEAALSL